MKSFIVVGLTLVLMTVTSCGTSKKAIKGIDKEVGTEVMVELPLQPSNNADTKEMYRAVGSGTSADWNMAKSIANTNARAELTTKLEAIVKTAVESYTNQFAASTTENTIVRDMGQTIQSYALVTAK